MKFYHLLKVLLLVFMTACSKQDTLASPTPEETPQASLQALKIRGDQVYHAYCIACHNVDPSKEGTLGPALQGSSEELLTARVIKGDYPPGYTPKRTTKMMMVLPHVQPDIPALHAYLNP